MLMAWRGAAQIESTNVIGYLNSAYPEGYALIANQLEAEDNSVYQLMPLPPDGTELVKLESQGWRTNVFNSTWMGWKYPDMTLVPGEAALLYSTAYWTQTWVGRILESEYEIQVPAGASLRSSPIPQSGRLSGLLQFPRIVGTRIYRIDSSTGGFVLRATCTEAGWEPEDPVLLTGEGFYIEAPQEFLWKRTFDFKVAISQDDQGRGILLTPEQTSGRKATIEVSSDLLQWEELKEGEQFDGSVLDQSFQQTGTRFYRARLD